MKITKGFISGNLKNLFDRMIPLYLPYTTYKTGESMHVKRYERYPTVEVYYQGTFRDEENKRTFHTYIERVFYQFYSKVEKIGHIDEYLCQGREF